MPLHLIWVMFIRQGSGKVFVIPVVVHLLALYLPINLLIGQMASGKDVVVDSYIDIAGDSRRPNHEEELSPYHSMHDPLRQRMEEGKQDPRSRDEYLRFHTQGKDKKAGQYRLEDPGYPFPKEKGIGEGAEGANAATLTWAIEAVDAPKYFLNYFSSRAIAVDTISHPHVVYGGDHLYYVYHDGAAWHYETADLSSGVGSYASIALDTSGKAHISYYDSANVALKYATNATGSWITTIVDSSGGVGTYTCIALDTSGKVHISYTYDNGVGYFVYNADLKYATNESGSWVTTTVDSNGIVGWYTSIVVDALDQVRISYFDRTNSDLKYATNGSGSWITSTVDSNGYVGW